MDITSTLNEVLVRLFRDITTIEERAIKTGEYKELTVNDMHVIEAIDVHEPKNMTTVAKALSVTTGTLTISVNGLVKKGYVNRTRSEEDRRVVLISLTRLCAASAFPPADDKCRGGRSYYRGAGNFGKSTVQCQPVFPFYRQEG